MANFPSIINRGAVEVAPSAIAGVTQLYTQTSDSLTKLYFRTLPDFVADYIDIMGGSTLAIGTNDFAFTAWSYPTAKNTVGGIILAAPPAPAGYIGIHYGYNNLNKYVALASSNGTSWNVIGDADNDGNLTDSTINNWYFVEYSRTSGVMYLYINGKLSFRVSGKTDSIWFANSIRIGQWNNGDQYHGYLEEYKIMVGSGSGGHTCDAETAVGTQVYNPPKHPYTRVVEAL